MSAAMGEMNTALRRQAIGLVIRQLAGQEVCA